MAFVFFFSGMGFKLSLVPFHLWTADVYEGAPSVVTAYLSVISKGSAAFVLIDYPYQDIRSDGGSMAGNSLLGYHSFYHPCQPFRPASGKPETPDGIFQYLAGRLHHVGCDCRNATGYGIIGVLCTYLHVRQPLCICSDYDYRPSCPAFHARRI